MDYDADGDEDIISGSYTGEIYFFERKDDDTLAQGVYLMNNQDEVLHVGISVVPELMDTDADGDLDMVVGTRSDGVWLFENTGTRANPAWAASGKELKTESGKEVEGSNAHHADWNGDGRIDLITGSEWGGAKWYKNVGKPNAPVYEDAKALVEKNEYAERTEEEGPVGPGSRTKVHVTDWNADGKADLLVGDVQWLHYTLPPLTKAEKKEKVALKPVYEFAEEKYYKVVDERNSYVGKEGGIPEDVLKRYRKAGEEFFPISSKWYAYDRKRSNTHGWVWLYLQK